MGGVVDPGYHGKIGLLLHSGSKEDCAWDAGEPWSISCATVSCEYISVKLQQPNPGMMTKGTDPSESMSHCWRREPGLAEVLAESGGNTEWGVEEGSYKYQLRSHDQSQK